MIYDNLTNDYLNGDQFSNAAIINLNHKHDDIMHRDEYLLKISKDKNILHLGFVDHLPLIDEKIKKGNWLHKKLMDVSNICYGVDINKDGIDYIKSKYKHIGSPVEFLQAIRERFKNNTEKIILTTPNGLRWNNFINSFKSIEVINTDHRFWFTPFTLSKIVIDAGYKINNIGYFEHGKLSRRQIIKKFILSKYNAFRDTLIIDISLK